MDIEAEADQWFHAAQGALEETELLKREMSSIKRSRDEAMTTAAEAVRKAKFWECEARKLGWKAKG